MPSQQALKAAVQRTFGVQCVEVISLISEAHGQVLIELDDETVGSRVLDLKDRDMLSALVSKADEAMLAARKAAR